MKTQLPKEQTNIKKQLMYSIFLVLGVLVCVWLFYYQTKLDFWSITQKTEDTTLLTGNTQTITNNNTWIDVSSITFKATGTEPFWSLSFGSWNATYTSPDNISWETYTWFTITAQDTTSYTLTNPQNMIIVIASNTAKPQNCSDGMSEIEYNGYITLTLPNAIVLDNGCIQTTLFNQ